jgi:hypothetical protein
MRVVIFPHNLYLVGVTLHLSGQVKSGDVVNGGWRFENRDGEDLCKEGNSVVTRYKEVPQFVVEVPTKIAKAGDYNFVINWAKEELKLVHGYKNWDEFANRLNKNFSTQGKLSCQE